MNVNIDINRQQQLPDGSTNKAPREHALDATDEAVTTTTKLDDRVKRCEEGCLLPTSIDDYVDKKENDINNDNDLQSPLRRLSSISDYTKRCLPEDTFSFLIYFNIQSRTFFLAAFVFSLQIAILVILSLDIIDLSKAKNPMSFPPNVDYPVRISEALAIVIAIITQEDVRKAVNLLRDGFDQNLAKAFKGATAAKWTLSIVLRASEGLLGLFVTFLLIMRSSSVLDLLLNFLAVEFVTCLDDVAFALMSEGFLGRMLKKEATKLSNAYYHVSHRSMDSRNAFLVTAAYFVGLFTAFFAGWAIIFKKQMSGEYLCDTIYAQFGDEVVPKLGTFSGLFFQHNKTFNGRLSYRDDQVEGALLAYCHEEKRWTLSLTTDDVFIPCNWLAASSDSVDFDVLTTASSPWIVRASPTSRILPLTQRFLACHDEYGCQTGHYGLRCEYPDPCPRLEIDPRDQGFAKTGGSYFATKFYRLEGAETYNHPVYTSLHDNQTLSDETDIILFTGVRWILSYKHLFLGLKGVNDKHGLAEYFSSFHGYFTNYSASYVSEPVHIDAPVDATASPLSVRWRYSASDSRDQRLRPDLQKDFIEASFFCGVCNNSTNPCQFGAVCLSDGSCSDCPNDSSGTMCQIPPVLNGKCNPYFNNINFGFDGGDCCENTCRSTPENICGKAGQGYIDTGYPSCIGTANQWQLSGDPIYGVSSASRSGLAVALGGKGNILAVADPGVATVRLFDKDGAEWIQRGQHVQGPSDSNFGVAISLSDESFNITRNPLSSPTVTLAVGAPKLGLVRVFKCSTIGCMQRGEDIVGIFASSLSIAKDGNSIAIGGDNRVSSWFPTGNHGEVRVFTWSNDMNYWQQKGNVTIVTPWSRKLMIGHFSLQGYYVSLSGDYLAVGTLEGYLTPGPRYESVNLLTQVYKWDESTGWAQLGDGIEKEFYDDASFRAQWPLKPVVLRGSKLAIGSKSSVDVYEWNEASSEWIPRGLELEGSEVNELPGWTVDLSEDANILAVGTSVENPQPTVESIRMYKWDGKRYNALFNGVPGGPVASVSLSSDGKAVAVGLPFDAWKGGSTRVYSFHQPSPCNDPSEVPLRISFTTDASPEETSWELRVDSQVKRSSGSLTGNVYTTFVEEMCVPATSCMKFIVYDSRGDGLNPPGVFSLMFNGKEEARGVNFGFYNVTSFGDCDCLEDEVPFTLNARSNFYDTAWSVLEQNRLSRRTGWNLNTDARHENSFSTLVVDECIPKDCYYLYLRPSSGDPQHDFCIAAPLGQIYYDATYNGESIVSTGIDSRTFFCQKSYKFGECSSTSPATCEDGSNLIKIEITLGEMPWDTHWALVDEGADNTTILDGGRYEVQGATIFEEICKPTNACYYFQIRGDAKALIFLDGKEIFDSNKAKTETRIGDSCPTSSPSFSFPVINVAPKTFCEKTCDSAEACQGMCEQSGSVWGWVSDEQSDTSMPFAGCFYKKGGTCWYGNFGSDEDKSEKFQIGTRERLCCDET